MRDSTKDKLAGAVHEAKGAAKEKVGQATKKPDLEAEGTDEKLAGKVQKKLATLKTFSKSEGGGNGDKRCAKGRSRLLR